MDPRMTLTFFAVMTGGLLALCDLLIGGGPDGTV